METAALSTGPEEPAEFTHVMAVSIEDQTAIENSQSVEFRVHQTCVWEDVKRRDQSPSVAARRLRSYRARLQRCLKFYLYA